MRRSYDFDGDEGWRSYLTQLTFPPGREDLILKKKAQYYKREVDPSLDIDALLATAKPAGAQDAPPPRREAPAPTAAAAAPKQPSKPRAAASAPRSGPQAIRLGDVALLLGHLFLIVGTLVSIQPFNGLAARVAFVYTCRVSLFVHGFRLFRAVGAPSFATIRPWGARATSTTEFFYFITSLVLSNNPSAWLVLVAMAILAAFHASSFLNAALGHTALWARTGAAPHAWLARNREGALQVMAFLEVVTVFQIALSALRTGPRALLSTCMFLNQLRGRYANPETKRYHAAVWNEIGRMAQPVVRLVPGLQGGVAVVQRWFLTPQVRQAQA